ncbi:MAG: hypothetical protein WA958_10235 [Tunicatimonas sp.]
MKLPLNLLLWRIVIVLTSGALLTSCISYGPALLGSEQPVVPLATLDSVPTVATGGYGTLGWPIGYGLNDGNTLVGAGVYQSRSLAYHSQNRKRGWSFVYGAMGYAGRYRVARDSSSYRYGGGLLHGAARWHLPISERATFVLEPGLSLFYEDGSYRSFRQEVRQDSLSFSTDAAQPLSATLLFSQTLHYRLNAHWSLMGVYTTGLPTNQFLFRYQFAGALAVTRDQLTLWARPAVHLSIYGPLAAADYTLATGLSYQLRKQ